MPKVDISEFNRTWGICGFTSALTHLYDSDSRLKGKIDSSSQNAIRLGLLTEVVTFLKYVKTFRGDLIKDLDALNKALNSPSMNNGVAGFIPLAEQAVRSQLPIGTSNTYQCALTPEALTLYLQQMCGFMGARLTKGSDPGGQGILGLMSATGELLHWVYRDANRNVYNWGVVIPSSQWDSHAYGLGYHAFSYVGCHISFN